MVYTNLKWADPTLHGMFESSLMRATDVGRLYDAVLDKDVDNGVAIKIGEYTGDGLQTRKATVAKKGDKIAVTGNPALVKDAFTKAQAQPYNYTNKVGKPVKAYQVDEEAEDVFAVASYQFTGSTEPKVGDYVVVNEDGLWKAQAAAPANTTYGFIGRVHSLAVGTFFTMVRIQTIQNKQL